MCVDVNGRARDVVCRLVLEDGSPVAAGPCLSRELCVHVRTALPVRVRRAVCARSRACMCLRPLPSFQALRGFGVGLRGLPESLGIVHLRTGVLLGISCGGGGGGGAAGIGILEPLSGGTWDRELEERIGTSPIPEERGLPVWAQLRPDGGREGGLDRETLLC